MTCEIVLNHAAAYLGGELSPAERTEIETHLADCASCRAELVGLSNAAHALRAVTVSPVEAERRASAIATPVAAASMGSRTSEHDRPEPRVLPARWWVAPIRYAAVILLAFGAGFAARGWQSTGETAGAPGQPGIDRPVASRAGVSDVLVRQYQDAASEFPSATPLGRSLIALAKRQG